MHELHKNLLAVRIKSLKAKDVSYTEKRHALVYLTETVVITYQGTAYGKGFVRNVSNSSTSRLIKHCSEMGLCGNRGLNSVYTVETDSSQLVAKSYQQNGFHLSKRGS